MATVKESFKKRFQELSLEMTALRDNLGENADAFAWHSFKTAAFHLIEKACGKNSVHFLSFQKAVEYGSSHRSAVDSALGIFQAAARDFENGLFDIESTIAGDIFSDFTRLASQAIEEGQTNVAAVLACAALEDTLKRLASNNGLDVIGKDLSDVINALKSSGTVRGGQSAILKGMPKIRNAAMHADWDKISEPEVKAVIAFVDGLIALHFSPT